MSYDVHIKTEPCPTCSHSAESDYDTLNPTYNLTPIFDLALTGEPMPNADVGEAAVVLFRAKTDRPRGLRVLDGRRLGDTVKMLENAMARLRDPAMVEQFAALEPDNGWGTVRGALSTLEMMLARAVAVPDGKWDIH